MLKKTTFAFIICCGLVFAGIADVSAQQRTTLEQLIQTNRTPSVYFDFIYTPAEDGKTRLDITFRINYDYLTFRRQNVESEDGPISRFISDIEMQFDIYDRETAPIPDRPLIAREVWTKQVIEPDYEETQSKSRNAVGFVTFTLSPDKYRIIPTINVNGVQVAGIQTTQRPLQRQSSRLSRNRDRSSSSERGLTTIPDLAKSGSAQIVLLSKSQSENETSLKLMNFGRNVFYAQDYSLLISSFGDTPSDSLIVEIRDIGPIERPDRRGELVWQKNIGDAQTLESGLFNVITSSSDEKPNSILKLEPNSTGNAANFIVDVPNHKFKNSWYTTTVVRWADGDSTHIASKRYLSRWVDIPSSLLNLDVAIDMLRFIVDREELREMRRGSAEQKEEKFRAFWSSRNPTPETDFNELMAEYYRRIDYVFREFSTPSTPGYESDQGKIYIVYGPPDNIQRRLPAGGGATEIWTYGSRTFIFNATTGFGDFRLVNSN